MNTSKKIISLLMCMLMVLSMVPLSVFAVEATEIDTVHIEGLPAPLYGQTVEEYYTAILDERGGGTLTVNDEAFDNTIGKYGNLFDEGLEVKKNDTVLSSTSTELITEGNYYVVMTLYPAGGYVIPDDVAVTVDGAVSVEKDFDEYDALTVYAKYEVKATEIGTVQIEGVPAPVYGQTVKEYNTVMYNGSMDGTHKINGSTRVNNGEDVFYGNIELSDWDYYNSEKSYIAPSSADALPSVYYLVHWLYPAAGYKFPDDVAVTVDGAVSVETEIDEDGCLAVWAKFEIAPPTEIDTIHIEGVPAPLYGQVSKDYLDDVIAKVKVNNELYDSKNQAFGNLNVEWQTICDSTKTMLSSSETFSEGTYYYLLELYPKTGFVFADIDDISASVDGNASVELEASTVYDDTVLVWVKFEVECPHTYDNACDADCNICGDTREVPHSYSDVITKATLTTNGLIENKCSVCGDIKSTVTVYYPKTIKLSSAEVTYNGKVRSPSVTVKDSKGNTLVKGTDYDVTTPSGRKAPGQYTYTIKFKGNFSGEKKLTFTILPKAPAASDISATQSTSVINLKWKASAGATGYRVYQYSASKGKFVQIASIKTTSYKKSTNLKAGTEYKFKIKPYTKLSDGTVLWGTASAEFVTATECKAPSITSVTSPSKAKATVKWSDVSGETGYQLYYSTKKDSGYKKVDSYSANKLTGSKTFSTSSSGKTIYFKVRAYSKVNGQTIFSEWSAVKSVKIK